MAVALAQVSAQPKKIHKRSTAAATPDTDEDDEVTYICCAHGAGAALTAATCADVALPDDIELEQMDACRAAVTSCCESQMKQNDSCVAGIKLSVANKCSTADSDIAKACCQECTVGRFIGKAQGKSVCGTAPSPEDSPTTVLRKGASYSCCLEAAE